MRVLTLFMGAVALCGCGASRPAGPAAEKIETGWLEVFPGVRVDLAAGVVEVEGRVATDVHDAATPDVYLEVIACTRQTREYESLVVIEAAAAQVHAALLLVGLEPGRPGRWQRENDRLVPIGPTGDAVRVRLVYESEGRIRESACEDWIMVRREDGSIGDVEPLEFVFAGSGFRTIGGQERYLGDVEGTVIGLTTFGTEVIAPSAMHNPDSRIEHPTLMARGGAMPGVGQAVTIRIERVRDKSAP